MIMLLLYILIIFILFAISFTDVRFGTYRANPFMTKATIVVGIIYTLYLYYSSINAIDSASYQAHLGLVGSLQFTDDIAYYSFVRLVRDIWNDYKILRLIIGCIFILPFLLIIKIEKERLNHSLFFLLLLMYPYFQNMISLKNTIADSISVLSFLVYFKFKKKWISIPLTYFILILSAMFHDTAIVYVLLFTLMLIMKRIANLRRNYYLLFGVVFVMILVIRTGSANNFLMRLAGEQNVSYISRIGSVGFGFIIMMLLQIFFFYNVYYFIKQAEIERGANPFYNDIMLLFYSTLILIPLYSINVLFFRLFRNIMIFGYVISSENMNLNNNCRNRAKFMILIALILMLYDANGIGSIQSILNTTI